MTKLVLGRTHFGCKVDNGFEETGIEAKKMSLEPFVGIQEKDAEDLYCGYKTKRAWVIGG